MTLWDGILLVAAVLIAVRSLTAMMRNRANRLVEEVQKQVDAHREREKALKRKQRQQQANAA